MTDDQTVDDPIEAPEGFVPEAEVAALRQQLAKAQRLLKKAPAKPDPSALAEDPEIVRSIFDAHGVPYDDDGAFRLPETHQDAAKIEQDYRDRLAKARQQWESKDLTPAQQRAADLESQLTQMRGNTLRQQLESAARRAGLADDKFRPLPFAKDKSFAPIHAAADLFEWDPETGDHVLRDGDEIVYDGKTGRPVTPSTYWDHFRDASSEDIRREWFGDQRQRGSNLRHNGAARNQFTMTREQVRENPMAWRTLKQRAHEAGQSAQITD